MEDDKPNCPTCGLHGGVMMRLRTLFALCVLIIGLIGVSTASEIWAGNKAIETRHDLDVHTAEQNQRMKNIEQTVERIEDLLTKHANN
jgi:hypothetical protein